MYSVFEKRPGRKPVDIDYSRSAAAAAAADAAGAAAAGALILPPCGGQNTAVHLTWAFMYQYLRDTYIDCISLRVMVSCRRYIAKALKGHSALLFN